MATNALKTSAISTYRQRSAALADAGQHAGQRRGRDGPVQPPDEWAARCPHSFRHRRDSREICGCRGAGSLQQRGVTAQPLGQQPFLGYLFVGEVRAERA